MVIGYTTLPDVLDVPMKPDNDAGATTIREYLIKLLLNVWIHQEDFSGKRPFGNSGWSFELYEALGCSGHIHVNFDEEEGWINEISDEEVLKADELITIAIRRLGAVS